MLPSPFEFAGGGALKSERRGVKAQRTARRFEPLMKRPFEFLFPRKKKKKPLTNTSPRAALRANVLALACLSYVETMTQIISLRFPCFRGHVTRVYPLRRSRGCGKPAGIPGAVFYR